MFAGNKCSFFLKNHSASVVNLKRGHRGQRNLINSWDRRPCDHHQSTRLRPLRTSGQTRSCSHVLQWVQCRRGNVFGEGSGARPRRDPWPSSYCSVCFKFLQQPAGGAPVLQVHRGPIFTFIHRRKRGKTQSLSLVKRSLQYVGVESHRKSFSASTEN